ncbi:MAG: MEDS domain-containing protein, partial [Candidatus Omnitrophota bacterium]
MELAFLEKSEKEIGPLRKSGIDVVGDISWGTHFCIFYNTAKDLIDILVPYFEEGLKNNEFCMWITADPLNVDEAKAALSARVENLSYYIKKGQIEIIDYSGWYTKSGNFNPEQVLTGWIRKHNKALRDGYAGLRLTGNTLWLEKRSWKRFNDYEKTINNMVGNYNMLAICAYYLPKCGAFEIIDVVSTHQFALLRKGKRWQRMKSSEVEKARGQLQETELRYKWLLDTLQEGVLVVDDKKRVVYHNPKMALMLGYKIGALNNKKISEFMDDVSVQICKKKFLESKKGCVELFDLEFLKKDGKSIYTRISCIPVFNKMKKFIGIIAAVQDISDRKKMEDEIKSERDKTALYLETAPGMILILNKKAEVEFINKTGRKILGYRYNEIIGKNWFDNFLPKEARSSVRRVFKRAIDGFQTKGNVNPILNKKKELCYIEWYDTVLKDKDGNINGLMAVGQDISERKQAEEKIFSLAKFPEENPHLVIRINKDGTLNYMNKSVVELLRKAGLPKKKIFKILPENISQTVQVSLQDNRTRMNLEADVNGKIFSYTLSPIKDAGYVNLYGIDVTEKKKAQALLIKDKKSLEKAVRERTDALIKTQKELEEAKRLSDIGALAATIAHELRNPLGVIKAAAYNIKRKKQTSLLDSHLSSIDKKIFE